VRIQEASATDSKSSQTTKNQKKSRGKKPFDAISITQNRKKHSASLTHKKKMKPFRPAAPAYRPRKSNGAGGTEGLSILRKTKKKKLREKDVDVKNLIQKEQKENPLVKLTQRRSPSYPEKNPETDEKRERENPSHFAVRPKKKKEKKGIRQQYIERQDVAPDAATPHKKMG